jgi:alpha/beta superfamily hydrolase
MSERAVVIGPESRRLRAALGSPAGSARGGAVVCHPHPDYGGDMDNAVVVSLVRALLAEGWATLRFDFGPHAGRDEAAAVADVRVALASLAESLGDARPLALVGYSFGGWVACRAAAGGAAVARLVAIAPPLDLVDRTLLGAPDVPIRIVVGDRDTYCSAASVAAVQAADRRIEVDVLRGADHFFGGRENDVAARVVAALA